VNDAKNGELQRKIMNLKEFSLSSTLNNGKGLEMRIPYSVIFQHFVTANRK
jgi:hypothetical protein